MGRRAPNLDAGRAKGVPTARCGAPPIRGSATILGELYFRHGDYARGLEEFRLAGLIDPANYSPDPELGISAAPPANSAARIARGRRAVQLRPDAPDAHLALGVALLQAGENRAGLESLERARELDRSTAGLAAALGHAHVRLSNPSEAVPLFLEALESEPNNADLREALALVLYRLGSREEAVQQFELARIQRSESGSAR